ncbi:hypothetical protein HanXRQr2_Chr15g0717851 [Helianthus annuus]|uniref:Uncharacterized protein n=1 Tax=Helianthus annuus TaxID=4232 RepID=A0A9K3E460_HELAN|nr:hypothetical protein HanXRQr2_Chr15g0717851 [Helianthus annuus]KAJ0833299.1 hypothetical protein HanPSC8_Chr15g0688711 [Helianthus annuus]
MVGKHGLEILNLDFVTHEYYYNLTLHSYHHYKEAPSFPPNLRHIHHPHILSFSFS